MVVMKQLRERFIALSAGLLICAGAFLFQKQLKPFENLIYDVMMRVTAEPFGGSNLITLIDVDEASLSTVGQWPWPRDNLASIVDQVTKGGALALVFDAIFSEPDRMSPDRIAQALAGVADLAPTDGTPLPSFDQQFAAAIQEGRVVLGQANLIGGGSNGADPMNSGAIQRRPTINLISTDATLTANGPPTGAYQLDGVLSNIPELDEVATGLGVVALPPDSDGISRAMPLVFAYEDQILPSLALETLRVALQSRGQMVRFDQDGISEVIVQGRLGTLPIQTDRNGRLWIRFPALPEGKTRYFDVISAADLLQPDFNPQLFANRVVVFGSSAAGLFDLKSTPLGTKDKLPGMDLQALTLHQAVAGDMIRVEDATAWELLAALVFLVYAVVLMPRLPSLLNSGFWVLTLVAAVAVQLWFFLTQSTYFSLLNAFIFLLVFGAFALVADLMRRDRQRREIKLAFAQYLSPALVNKISRNPALLKLGGERKELTILFADLRGFTSVSEALKDEPEKLTSIVNAILTPLTDIVLEHQGTVDKYMGDCIMAFWNAPLDVENHADQAVKAAVAMVETMPKINEALLQQFGHSGFRLGVGVNSGGVIVGNLGSNSRFDYSVLGDAVNLAARLEGQSKTYGVDVIIGDDTYKRVTDQELCLLQIDEMRVKGKAEPVKIYTPVSRAPEADVQAHARVLEAYQYGEFRQAQRALTEMAGRFAGKLDALYQLLLNRREAAEQGDGETTWNGVWDAQDK